MLAVFAAGVGFVFYGPLPQIRRDATDSPSITDRNGVVLYEPLTASGVRGEWLGDVPPNVAAATIAAEDRRFHSHIGIDPIAIGRAALHDLRARRIVEGGSTITQQVAKMLLANADLRASVVRLSTTETRRRGVLSKLHEALIALRLERKYSKKAILALYLNLAPYGNQTHGIARASRRYFGVAPEELTPAEAAFLAALPQRPTSYNPLRDARRAIPRQRAILKRMDESGALPHDEYVIAAREQLRFSPTHQDLLAQHFVERVLEGETPAAGRTIRTTLDSRLQEAVRGIIAAHRADLLAHNAHSVAVAVLDNATGDWLAWEGSGDYFGSGFGGAIDGVSALRQPGSTLKPFTYAAAFEQGRTPATVLADVPSVFSTAEQGIVYSPRNYDGVFRGPLRARAALAGSENVPAVALLSSIGAPSLLRLLRNAGFADLNRTADYYGLGLTLGDPEIRLEQLVAAYAAFARGGTYLEPRFVVGSPRSDARKLVSPRTAFWITDILADADAREYIFGSGGALEFPFPVAVKTGTSQAYRDNWTIGYTRDVTVGVWVGNFDRSELRGSSGVTGAAPIFHDVMMAAARPSTDAWPVPPAELEQGPVCALSGLRPSLQCPVVEKEWVDRSAAVEFCSWHRPGGVDWPVEYRTWAQSQGLLESTRVASAREVRGSSLRVTSPPDGATYLIDPTLRSAYQTLRLQAASAVPVQWSVNGRKLASSEWALRPGRHVFTASDARGNRASATVVVR